MATKTILKRSTGTTLNAAIDPVTARSLVKNGSATVTTPGVTGYDVITLKTAAHDTAHANATAGNPVILELSDITFKPHTYPENL